MKVRVSINPDQVALEDAWEHYQTSRDSIVQAAEHTKRSVFAGTTIPSSRFFAMSIDEVDEFFAASLDETDKQACLFLVASAEAALRVDFLQRVYNRKKDAVSRAFRSIYKTACNHSRLTVKLDEDILETWSARVPKAKTRVGDLRGALNYRHWLAHGRYWVPKLGRQYDPSGLLRIIIELFEDIRLANQ
jgi:hypothetical protein